MLNQLQQFHQKAVQYKLASSAILLWQYLYLTMTREGQFIRLHQNTADLMAALNLSRRGLFQARKSLRAAGLLTVEQDERQKLWYSLQLDGAPVQPAQPEEAADDTSREAAKASGEDAAQLAAAETANAAALPGQEAVQTSQQPAKGQPPAESRPLSAVRQDKARSGAVRDSRQPNCVDKHVDSTVGADSSAGAGNHGQRLCAQSALLPAAPKGDIVMNKGYSACLQDFCDRYENISLQIELTRWMEQRAQNGWTLTLWGLEALLQKLVQLAAGQIGAMVEIIRQSVQRRWKGFHPVKP